MLRTLVKWFRLHWLGLFFKVKNTLPESPPQEAKTSNTSNDIIVQELETVGKAKQEKQQWFTKPNDLRDVVFDLNPVWDNHPGIEYADPENTLGHLKAVSNPNFKEPIYKDEVEKSYSPWDDLERFPKKNYQMNIEELNQLKLTEDGNNKTDDTSSGSSGQ